MEKYGNSVYMIFVILYQDINKIFSICFLTDARIRALAAAWARHDHFLADAFLEDKDNFGVNEILKAVSLLDAGRQVRVLEKKMKRLQFSTGKVKPQTMGKLKSDIDNLNSIKPQVGIFIPVFSIKNIVNPDGSSDEGPECLFS